MTPPLPARPLRLAPDLALDPLVAVAGWQAGVARGDVKGTGEDREDVAVLVAPDAATAALTTRSTAAAAPCRWTRARVPGRTHAVVVNSGNANAATGVAGPRDTHAMAAAAAARLGCSPEAVLVCSTGVIGVPLPTARLLPAVARAATHLDATGAQVARSILTTDLVPKVASSCVAGITVAGFAKGSGMIHPGMATMLGFLATDADVDPRDLQPLLASACDRSFHAISVDGDTSTNDTVVLQATGRGERVGPGTASWRALEEALTAVCTRLARAIAADGEGATTLVHCLLEGGADDATARAAARTVIRSPLVKTAVHGRDPNWGRIVGALGAAGLPDLDALDLDLGGVPVLRAGAPLPFDEAAASAALRAPEVLLHLRLPGPGLGRAWGCDLSDDYVRINADYRS